MTLAEALASRGNYRPEALVPRLYDSLQRAVESGVNWGWHYSHKYDDRPSEERIKQTMIEQVMSALFEDHMIRDGGLVLGEGE